MAGWIQQEGPENDIVISSRVRLARNIEDIPFPHQLDDQASKAVADKVYDGILMGNINLKEDFQLLAMKDLDQIERLNYIEKHLISPDLVKNVDKGSMLINKDETISILINEEDHIRIQCLLPGLQLEKAYDISDKIDDLLEERIDFAFDEDLGYLTACPTNLGTGIRVSVMLHLPVLRLTGYINTILQAAGQIGLAVRGIYGEGTEISGDIYQISNQVTLGVTEKEVVGSLHNVTMQIIEKERKSRNKLLKTRKIDLEDRLFRSLGILKNARKIAGKEAMQLISDVKLGANLGLMEDINMNKINSLITMIQPGYLQKYYNTELNPVERDIKRAKLIRENL